MEKMENRLNKGKTRLGKQLSRLLQDFRRGHDGLKQDGGGRERYK